MFCNLGQEGELRDYFTVLNSIADTHKNPHFGHFMLLQAADSNLSKKA